MGYLLPCIFKWLLNYAIVPKKNLCCTYIHVFVLSMQSKLLKAENNALLAGPAPCPAHIPM